MEFNGAKSHGGSSTMETAMETSATTSDWDRSNLDDLLNFQAPKVVVIRDRRLGCLQVLLCSIIGGYVLGFQILYCNDHFERKDVAGTARIEIQQPTRYYCNPNDEDCENAWAPLEQLSYCKEYAGSNPMRPDYTQPCAFVDKQAMAPQGMVEEHILIPTYIVAETQTQDCTPDATNGHSCGREYVSSGDEESVFVADVENYALRISHTTLDIRAGSGASHFTHGYVLECDKNQKGGFDIHTQVYGTGDLKCEGKVLRKQVQCLKRDCEFEAETSLFETASSLMKHGRDFAITMLSLSRSLHMAKEEGEVATGIGKESKIEIVDDMQSLDGKSFSHSHPGRHHAHHSRIVRTAMAVGADGESSLYELGDDLDGGTANLGESPQMPAQSTYDVQHMAAAPTQPTYHIQHMVAAPTQPSHHIQHMVAAPTQPTSDVQHMGTAHHLDDGYDSFDPPREEAPTDSTAVEATPPIASFQPGGPEEVPYNMQQVINEEASSVSAGGPENVPYNTQQVINEEASSVSSGGPDEVPYNRQQVVNEEATSASASTAARRAPRTTSLAWQPHSKVISTGIWAEPHADVFTVEKLLSLADVSLDQIPAEGGEPIRKSGSVITIEAIYSNLRPWTPFGTSRVEYEYRVTHKPLEQFQTEAFSQYQPNFPAQRVIETRHGLYVVVKVTGKFGEFSLKLLFILLATAMGLLGAVKKIVEVFAMNCMNMKETYRKAKYEYTERIHDMEKDLNAVLHEDIDAGEGTNLAVMALGVADATGEHDTTRGTTEERGPAHSSM
jgi:hypothetical protein